MVAIPALSACAIGGMRQVSITAGELADVPQPLSSMSMYVVPNTQMNDTLLEARVRARVEESLLAKGYKLGSPEAADVYVLASFGAAEVMGEVDVQALYPPMTKTLRGANGTLIRRTYGEHLAHEKVEAPVKSVVLILSASDAKLYRETGTVRPIWKGEASTPVTPALLDRMIPYLLASTLKYFGKNSDGEQSIEIRDKEIKGWTPAK
jgi:hypothetical protein